MTNDLSKYEKHLTGYQDEKENLSKQTNKKNNHLEAIQKMESESNHDEANRNWEK